MLQRLVTDGVEPLRLVIDGCQTSQPGADGVKTRQRRQLSIQTVITEESLASYKQPINKPAKNLLSNNTSSLLIHTAWLHIFVILHTA